MDMDDFGVLWVWGFSGDSHGFLWVWDGYVVTYLKYNPHGSPDNKSRGVGKCRRSVLIGHHTVLRDD